MEVGAEFTGAAVPFRVPPVKKGTPPGRVVPACAGPLIPRPAVKRFIDVTKVETILAFIVGKTFVVVSAFEIQTLPRTLRVAPAPVVLIPTKPVVPNMARVFKEAAFALVVAKTLGVEREFEIQTFPATLRAAPAPVVLIPTKPVVPIMAVVFSEAAFALVVAKTLGVASAFETHTFPAILRVAPAPVVLIPTKPVVPNMARVFKEATLAFTVAKMLGVARLLEAQTLPATLRVAPPPAQFRPTKPVVDTIVVVMRLVTLANEVAKTF